MKPFDIVISESTCQKRVTVVEIYDKENNLLSRESNRCSPNDGTCQRLSMANNKENYPVESTCNWTHAEINAIASLPVGSLPYKSILYGHDFYCDKCEKALKNIGVIVFEIENATLIQR